MSLDCYVVIPARYQSVRLPGKPLADICGKPMIVRTALQAQSAQPLDVIVATDDERVLEVVADAGLEVMLTDINHASGSDRVMEVADARGWPDDAIVINVQGDEPLIPPAVIRQVAGTLQAQPSLGVATLCEPIREYQTVFDANVVKVVTGSDNMALYFSRAPIPYARDYFSDPEHSSGTLPADGEWWRHIGIYGFRIAALRRFVGLPVARLESIEALEQLRMLNAGLGIHVEEACEPVPGGVDTNEDLEHVCR
ncbi:MAG: 3-deoxy-manno-octulosonate cytidylyltransferase, partial [Gammaproteobacteria bacterium]|nr:3-deoxy-manno-octulosonate cytidylyltransferase [Gammaproteobacteria bacterium]